MPVYATEGTVMIWYGMFQLLRNDGVDDEPVTPDDNEWVLGGHDWITAASAINDHEARIFLEYWSDSPLPPDGFWEKESRVDFQFTGGDLTAATVTGPDGTATINLPAGRYNTNVYYRGRDAVIDAVEKFHARMATNSSDEDWPSGFEEFLFQFWPSV